METRPENDSAEKPTSLADLLARVGTRHARRRSSSLRTLHSSMNVAPSAQMDHLDDGQSPWGDEPSQSASTAKDTPKESTPAPESPSVSQSQDMSSSQMSTTTQGGGGGGGRKGKRGPQRLQRVGAQSTKLEGADDPLGPLGESFTASGKAEEPPAPPQKELSPTGSRPTTAASASSIRGMMDSVNLNEEDDMRSPGPRVPPPVSPPTSAFPNRQTQPSMSVEQAAKPTFSITVGDPHKVGDLTSSHTVYQVTTKTSSKAYRTPEFTVSRRYRDFLWLYNQLHSNNPGVVVPPPPDKQAVGRFEANFIESRRSAMERMLNRTTHHPILQHDGDLKLFLESDSFNMDIRHKERKDPGLGESKGMFGGMLSVGSGGKFIEHDDWFHDRRIYLDALEGQLKALLKASDTSIAQRRQLSDACNELSSSLRALAAVELSPSLSAPLEGLADVEMRIQDTYARQAMQDMLTLEIVIEEYIRLIGSIKMAFQQRQKSYHAWHNAETEMQKRKATQDKLLRQGRSQQDRITQLGADVADAERKVHQTRLLFEDQGRLMRQELERFEKEKVEDFKSGIETYLESWVETQKELIEVWETFLMQLDAEEDGAPFGHSHPPAGVSATPSITDSTTTASETTKRPSTDDERTLANEDDNEDDA